MFSVLVRFAFRCLLPMVLAAGDARAQFTPAAPPVTPSLNVLGWSDYIDPKVMEEFGRSSGLRVVYDAFESEAAFEARFAEAKAYYDLAIVPARLLPKLIAAGQLQKLDRALVPSARDLWPEIGSKLGALDPANQYALAHTWLSFGLAYDVKQSAERLPEAQMASWDLLFRPDILKKFATCGVQLPDDSDLVLGVSLLAQKLAPDLRNTTDLKRATDFAARLRPLVTEYQTGGVASALADGEVCLALVSASDAALTRERGKVAEPPRDIAFVLPKEGLPVAIDALVVPKDAPHAQAAMRFAALLAQPDIAARNSALSHLANGTAASRALLAPSLRADKAIWPDDDVIKRMVVLPLPDATLRKMIEREWLKVKTGSYEPAPAEPVSKNPKVRPKAAGPAPVPPVPNDPKKKPKRPGGKGKG